MAFAPPLFSRWKALPHVLGRQKRALRRECFVVAVARRLQSWRSPSRTRLWRLTSRRISSTTSGVPYDSCPPSLPPALFVQIQLCPGISCGGGKILVLSLSRSFFVLKKAGSGFLFCVLRRRITRACTNTRNPRTSSSPRGNCKLRVWRWCRGSVMNRPFATHQPLARFLRPYIAHFPAVLSRLLRVFRRLVEAVPTSRKPEPRAKKQPASPHGGSSIQALSAYETNQLACRETHGR